MSNVLIKLTDHAKLKMKQRNIKLAEIRKVISNPENREADKFDKDLMHYIGKVRGKHLRVIVKQADKDEFIVISAFFDRRIKQE
ncbi:MAG TPA: DUF4258 domain-containing protein [Candidatus Marinimicrobia bacterium]|jgi:mRNA-degrading endonuclease RelE of RelBE toxin-antitoxin system|nr:DUF4258 domain-containing protein [Candidatus Neomarinimicrobiota bacterium]